MPWREPRSMEEYTQRMKISADPTRMATGMGLEVATSMPCPWCATEDFMKIRVVHAKHDAAQEATCRNCGRSGKNLGIDWDSGAYTGEFVQTGGPDAPDWLQPQPRRLPT